MNNIEQLLERYFEGVTSTEEERTLRRFFTSGNIPDNLMMYKPLFAYFENEIKKAKTDVVDATDQSVPGKDGSLPEGTTMTQIQPPESSLSGKEKETQSTSNHRNLILWLSGVAACAVLLIGTFFFTPQQPKCSNSGNYVIIDGQCYTDIETIRSAALKSLQEMSDDNTGTLSGKTPGDATDIIENQLKEFNSLFDDE